MLIKYIAILYFITTPDGYSVSIKKDIEVAKLYLRYLGIPHVDMCTKQHINAFCNSEMQILVCSARLVNKKMEFKEFDNSCYMNLENICQSQDSIWAIKNFGPCIFNADLRRYAEGVEKNANSDANNEADYDEAETTPDGETTTDDVTNIDAEDKAADDNEEAMPDDESTTDETPVGATPVDSNIEDATGVLRMAKDEDADDIANNDETMTGDENAPVSEDTDDAAIPEDETIAQDENMGGPKTLNTGNALRFGKDEIGKILYDDGSVKSLREPSRFPPLRANFSYDNVTRCSRFVKPCPPLYFPICLFYQKEDPNNVTYYHFINKCEALQYRCYNPEKKVDASSSMRAGFCAHIQYINYARFLHTMSAWSHYGWLLGPGSVRHMLTRGQRG